MAYNRTRSIFAGLAIAAAAVAFQAAPADAQVYYGGYNLGPDYGAMLQQQQRLAQQQQQQMMQHQQQMVAEIMQLPHFQQMYHQHRMQGGQLSPQQFAVEYAARGRFTEPGLRNFQNSRTQIEEQQRRGNQGLRDSEDARRRAQQGYMDGGHARNQEAGNGLQGRGTYVAPGGQNQVLSYLRPGQVQQDAQGNRYYMDQQGQAYVATPNGWQPMRPRY